MTIVIGIDPGGSTGVAVVDWDRTRGRVGLLHSETITGGLEGFVSSDWWLSDPIQLHTDVVAIERFIVEPSFVGEPVSAQIEGYIVGTLSNEGCVTIAPQLRSQKETLLPKKSETERLDWLREIGFEFGSTHEADALTHALVWLKNNDKDFLRMMLKDWYV